MSERRHRVLLADGDAAFRETAARLLGRRGFEVTPAGTAPEAVAALRPGGMDAAVIDWDLPSLDGKDLMERLQALKPSLPIIILTGPGSPRSAVEALRQGAFDYLLKPCTMELLAQRVEDAVAGRGGVAAAEPRVRDAMTPLSAFSAIPDNATVADAVFEIIEHFVPTATGSRYHPALHRSILVMDQDERVAGTITFRDVLAALRRACPEAKDHQAPGPGVFTVVARNLARTPVREIMSPAPPTVPADADLMEAAVRLLDLKLPRLLVVDQGKVIGVLREQDLFFEAASDLRKYQTLR